MPRQRLDQALVARGLIESRSKAVEAIHAQRVLVSGAVADKPGRMVDRGEPVVVVDDGPSFVSRGGQKLAAALSAFDIDVAGRSAIDAGSATGGFTDCLLQAGAARVIAVDVGYGQLHERLRSDPRVVSLERRNIKDLSYDEAIALVDPAPPASVLSADLSFTSLRPQAAHLCSLLGGHGDLVVLCKPQFEVGRQVAARGKGVVRDRVHRQEALRGVVGSLEQSGGTIVGMISSPILGPAGNAEFLVHARLGAPALAEVSLDELIEEALDQAEAIS